MILLMENLLAYDSTSSGSGESDSDLNPRQDDTKTKRRAGEINQRTGGTEYTIKQPDEKKARILDSSKPRESKSSALNDQLNNTAQTNIHLRRENASVSAPKTDYEVSSNDCSRFPISSLNKISVKSAERVATKTSSNGVGRAIKPYISKRERARETSTASVSLNAISRVHAQSERTEIDFSFRPNDRNSNLNKDETINQNTSSTCRSPKQLHLTLQGHSKGVNCVRWNPSQSNLLLSASMDHTVCVWDIESYGTCVKRLTCHTEAVKDTKWSRCGTQVLSCGYDRTARLTDLHTGQEIQMFPHKDHVTCVEFHPANQSLFLAGTFKSIILCWDARTGNVELKYTACFGQVQDLAFIPGGQEFISAAEVVRRNSTDKGIMVWDFKSTAILSNQIYQEAFTCTCLRVHPYESLFMAQSNGDYIALFSTRKPYKLNKFKRFEGHKVSGYHIGCDFSADGSIICSGSADGSIFFYNHQTSKIIRTLKAHTAPCMDVAHHPSLPSHVASCSWDSQVKVWT